MWRCHCAIPVWNVPSGMARRGGPCSWPKKCHPTWHEPCMPAGQRAGGPTRHVACATLAVQRARGQGGAAAHQSQQETFDDEACRSKHARACLLPHRVSAPRVRVSIAPRRRRPNPPPPPARAAVDAPRFRAFAPAASHRGPAFSSPAGAPRSHGSTRGPRIGPRRTGSLPVCAWQVPPGWSR